MPESADTAFCTRRRFHDHKFAFDHFYVVRLGHVIKLNTDMAFSYCTYSADSTIHQTSACVHVPTEFR